MRAPRGFSLINVLLAVTLLLIGIFLYLRYTRIASIQSARPLVTDGDSSYTFNNFGVWIDTNNSAVRYQEIETADFDGDGDPDVILVTTGGIIGIYENTMPQKK